MTELLLAVDPEQVKPGWLALLIVLVLAAALALLLRSLSRHLKKVDFPESGPEPRPKAKRTSDTERPKGRGDQPR